MNIFQRLQWKTMFILLKSSSTHNHKDFFSLSSSLTSISNSSVLEYIIYGTFSPSWYGHAISTNWQHSSHLPPHLSININQWGSFTPMVEPDGLHFDVLNHKSHAWADVWHWWSPLRQYYSTYWTGKCFHYMEVSSTQSTEWVSHLRHFFISPTANSVQGPYPPCREYSLHVWDISLTQFFLDRMESKAFHCINSSPLTDCLQPLSHHQCWLSC